ncbi:MAG: molybdopterin molybdotransferase MoeA [Thermomicrobiales bacterium]
MALRSPDDLAPDGHQAIGVDAARERILAAFAPLGRIDVLLADALGLALAADVIADSSVPAFANSAMDGFAVRSEDVQSTPARLGVIGEAKAGGALISVIGPGEAVRIMTGAAVPDGADAVVRFEDTDERDSAGADPSHGRTGREIEIRVAPCPGTNVRPPGEDFLAGERVLEAGARLRPADLGVLASLGRTHAEVRRRPRVAVIATGDEVVDPGEPLGPGQIRNSNTTIIAASVRRAGGEPVVLGIAQDRQDALRSRLAEAAGCDLILTTGGVSVGDYDMVKRVLQSDGEIALWQVKIKPGKPLAFGRLGGVPLLGLPGNPVAAAVAFEQFARPAIGRMLGLRDLSIPTVMAQLDGSVDNRGGRRHFVRARVRWDGGRFVATPAGGQGAGVLSTLARANALLVISEGTLAAEHGSVWPAQMLDWDGA